MGDEIEGYENDNIRGCLRLYKLLQTITSIIHTMRLQIKQISVSLQSRKSGV